MGEVVRHQALTTLNFNNFFRTQLHSSVRMAPQVGALSFAKYATKDDSNIVLFCDVDTFTSSSTSEAYSTGDTADVP